MSDRPFARRLVRRLLTASLLLAAACDEDSSGTPVDTTTTMSPGTSETRGPTTSTSTTTTSVTSTTSGGVTTTSIVGDCGFNHVVTFSVTNSETLGALQFDADYAAIDGSFNGTGNTVSCSRLAGDFASFNDRDDEKRLTMAFVSTAGFTGPIDIATCDFSCPPGTISPDEFVITITDQSKPDFSAADATVAVTRVANPGDGPAPIRKASTSDR